MSDEYTKKLDTDGGDGFIPVVLIHGTLKIGILAFLVWVSIDFLVEYGFNGVIASYPGNYYFRNLIRGLLLGSTVGFVNWIILRRAVKNSNLVN